MRSQEIHGIVRGGKAKELQGCGHIEDKK